MESEAHVISVNTAVLDQVVWEEMVKWAVRSPPLSPALFYRIMQGSAVRARIVCRYREIVSQLADVHAERTGA